MYDETQLWTGTGTRQDAGRHAIDEDAMLTPIFAALVRGGWRQRQATEAARFDRDPLTAPLPGTAPPVGLVPAQEGGRHHLRRALQVHSFV